MSISRTQLDRSDINRVIRQLANDYDQGLINLGELSQEIVTVNAIAGSLEEIHGQFDRVERLAADLNHKTIRTLNGG